MRKKTLLTIIFFIILITGINAQYPDNIFKNYTPKWQHYVYDSTAIPPMNPKEYNGILFKNMIFRDSFIYSLYEYNYLVPEASNGGYIEKLNINTGNLEWTTIYDLRTIDKNERPNRMFFNELNQLEVLGFRKRIREVVLYNPTDPTFKFIRRIYNPDNGRLIRKIHEKDSDTSGLIMYALDWRASLLPYGMNSYQYLPNYPSWELKNISSILLDTLGIAIDTLIYDLNCKYYRSDMTPFKVLSPDTMVTVFYTYNDYFQEEDSFDVEFYMLLIDQDFNHIDSFNITEAINTKNYYDIELKYADDKIIVVGLIDEPEPFDWKSSFLIFDYKGNLLDTIDLNDVSYYTCNIELISDDEYLIYGMHKKNDYGNFRFYKKKIGEKKKLLREIEVNKLGKYFYCDEMHLVDDNLILIGEISGRYKEYCCFYRYPMIIDFPKGDILNYVDKQEEITITKKEMELYPSPVEKTLTVDFKCNFIGTIEIIDVLGRKSKIIDIENQLKKQIDISFLNKGVYYIKAISKSKNKLYNVKSFVVE